MVEGWVDQSEVTVLPQFVDVRLSVAVGMLGASEQEWSDYLSMFARAVRHVHFYQISRCSGLSVAHSVVVVRLVVVVVVVIDREFVTSAKKFVNFNESFEIKKIRKNSYKNSLNARVGVAFQWNSLLI